MILVHPKCEIIYSVKYIFFSLLLPILFSLFQHFNSNSCCFLSLFYFCIGFIYILDNDFFSELLPIYIVIALPACSLLKKIFEKTCILIKHQLLFRIFWSTYNNIVNFVEIQNINRNR